MPKAYYSNKGLLGTILYAHLGNNRLLDTMPMAYYSKQGIIRQNAQRLTW